MKLDVAIPHTLEIPALSQPWELALGHKEVIGAMKLADELGFRKCMLGEHFLIPDDHLSASGAYWHHGTVFFAGAAGEPAQIGRAHVGTPVTNAHLVCRSLLEKKKTHEYK